MSTNVATAPRSTFAVAAKSDLSGEEFEGGNEPVAITVRLPDGRRRELQVSAGEAAALAGMGRALADRGGGLRAPRQALKWAIVLVVGSLAIPSVTKQWSDRSRELETKAAIVTKTSEASATTINTIRYIIGDVLPAASARKAAANALADAKANREANLGARRAKVKRATSAEQKIELATYNRLKNEWGKTGAVVEAQLQSYFPLTDLPDQWHSYLRAVTNYLRVASSLCGDERRRVVDALAGYRSTRLVSGIERSDLLLLLSADCRAKNLNFQASYFQVGERLLDEQARLVRQIVGANAAGYSSGWGDFWRDIVPG